MERPVTGITHVNFKCNDFMKMFEFYNHKLNFPLVFSLNSPFDGNLWLAYVHVQDDMFIELHNTPYKGENGNALRSESSVVFFVEELDKMRSNLMCKGVAFHENPEDGFLGNSISVYDPEGNELLFAEDNLKQ